MTPHPPRGPLDSALAVAASDLWILYRSGDPEAAHRYCSRRLMDAAGDAGLSAMLVDPNRVAITEHHGRRAVLRLDGRRVGVPRAVISRSGSRLGNRGRRLISVLEAAGSTTVPSARALAFAGDKLTAARVLERSGVPTPRVVALPPSPDPDWLAGELGFPLVVKNAQGSKGLEVRLCEGPSQIAATMQAVAGKGAILAQRFVAHSRGRDVRVMVIDGRVVTAMMRCATGDEFRSNVACGGTARAVDPTRDMTQLALRAAAVLNLDVAGVDLLFDGTGLTVCEVNTAPGFEQLEQATGHDIAGSIIDHLRRSMAGTAVEAA